MYFCCATQITLKIIWPFIPIQFWTHMKKRQHLGIESASFTGCYNTGLTAPLPFQGCTYPIPLWTVGAITPAVGAAEKKNPSLSTRMQEAIPFFPSFSLQSVWVWLWDRHLLHPWYWLMKTNPFRSTGALERIYIEVFYFLHKENEDFWWEGRFLDKDVSFSLTLELAGKMEKENHLALSLLIFFVFAWGSWSCLAQSLFLTCLPNKPAEFTLSVFFVCVGWILVYEVSNYFTQLNPYFCTLPFLYSILELCTANCLGNPKSGGFPMF